MKERLNFANQLTVNVDTPTSYFFTDFTPWIVQKSLEYYETLQAVKDQDGTFDQYGNCVHMFHNQDYWINFGTLGSSQNVYFFSYFFYFFKNSTFQ